MAKENCYLPENATDKDGFDGIVTLTAIDMSNPTNLQSVCINTQVNGIYASANSVYLYGTDYNYEKEQTQETSIIHKFSIDGLSINYNASGTLNGRFNWDMSNLRFSEQGNYLRVVTTAGNRSEGFDHRLNILTTEGNKLVVASQLPNDTNKKVIGKVNDKGFVQEDIKAVRFFGDKAYVVTFLNTDPLYIIDLTIPTAPIITGELEIPGYSAYLHPLSENLLLGIGQNIDPNLLPINIDGSEAQGSVIVEEPAIVEGAKVTLFNVSDITQPKEISSIVFEDGYTPVEFDYHALTYMQGLDGKHRFALPVERWVSETTVDPETDQKMDVWSSKNTLELLEISSSDESATLSNIGRVEASSIELNDNYISSWDDRAVFHDNDVYYIHGKHVWHGLWNNPESSNGPF